MKPRYSYLLPTPPAYMLLDLPLLVGEEVVAVLGPASVTGLFKLLFCSGVVVEAFKMEFFLVMLAVCTRVEVELAVLVRLEHGSGVCSFTEATLLGLEPLLGGSIDTRRLDALGASVFISLYTLFMVRVAFMGVVS